MAATASFVQNGDSINHTPTSAVSAGDVVVVGNIIGVALEDIAANVQGSIKVSGVFTFPKAATYPIVAGGTVYWDAASAQATWTTDSNTNQLLGKAVAAAAETDTTVIVRLCPDFSEETYGS